MNDKYSINNNISIDNLNLYYFTLLINVNNIVLYIELEYKQSKKNKIQINKLILLKIKEKKIKLINLKIKNFKKI